MIDLPNVCRLIALTFPSYTRGDEHNTVAWMEDVAQRHISANSSLAAPLCLLPALFLHAIRCTSSLYMAAIPVSDDSVLQSLEGLHLAAENEHNVNIPPRLGLSTVSLNVTLYSSASLQ